MTLYFSNDYSRGAHPKVIEKIVQTNMQLECGYGFDSYCSSAKNKIKKSCGKRDAEVYFLVGGTQTNATVIKSILKQYEGVIAPDTGHISTHEAGIIEVGGHKVIELTNYEGKIRAIDVKNYIDNYNKDEIKMHMVTPGMVYITFPTEYGTLYSKNELEELYDVCKENNIPLYVDGARLGYGLVAKECDMTFNEFSNLCDIFYIGGTKVGALCGEAVVFSNKIYVPNNFPTLIKQMGGLLAKGRLLGVQFDALFTDDLYFEISRNAIKMANRLKRSLKSKNYKFFIDSATNQQFIILENKKIKELQKFINFSIWENYNDDNSVIRLVTDWSTTEEDIDKVIKLF